MTAGKFVRRRGKMTPHSLSHHLGRPRVHEASGGNTQDLHLSDSLRCVAASEWRSNGRRKTLSNGTNKLFIGLRQLVRSRLAGAAFASV